LSCLVIFSVSLLCRLGSHIPLRSLPTRRSSDLSSALLVSEPTMYAIAGAGRALDAIETVRARCNPTLRPAGVLVNRFREKSYGQDRKSTRLYSSHVSISYAVFCWKNKR